MTARRAHTQSWKHTLAGASGVLMNIAHVTSSCPRTESPRSMRTHQWRRLVLTWRKGEHLTNRHLLCQPNAASRFAIAIFFCWVPADLSLTDGEVVCGVLCSSDQYHLPSVRFPLRHGSHWYCWNCFASTSTRLSQTVTGLASLSRCVPGIHPYSMLHCTSMWYLHTRWCHHGRVGVH